MIEWKGRQYFIEVMDRIAAAGVLLVQDSEGWHCSDEMTAQVIVDAYTLDDAKSFICGQIIERSKAARDKKLQSVSPGEMAAWYMKLSQARAFAMSGLVSDAPDLVAEAEARGVTLAELCAKVDSNAKALAALEATIAGREGFHKDKVRALTTFEDVAAYDFSTGWPEV